MKRFERSMRKIHISYLTSFFKQFFPHFRSSGLLFLIVASEGIHVSDKPRGIDQEENIQSEYVVKEIGEAHSESVDNKIPDVRARPTVKTEQEHFHAAVTKKKKFPKRKFHRTASGHTNLH